MNSGSSASTSIAVFKPDASANPDFVLNQPRIWLGEICGSLSIRPSRPRFTGLQSSLRWSVVKALFSSNRMKGAWGSQARYLSRPGYRVTSEGTKAQLHQVNLASLTFFWIQCWLSTGVTQPAAHTFGEAPNWAQYSWVIAKAATRGSATWITHCSKTGAAAPLIAIGALLLTAGHWARSRPPNSIRS
jgi:hypothetical protein